MSRGPGKEQRMVIEIFAENGNEWMSVADLGKQVRKKKFEQGWGPKTAYAALVDQTTPSVERGLRSLLNRGLVERDKLRHRGSTAFHYRLKCREDRYLHLESE